jgi:hypothetical protein
MSCDRVRRYAATHELLGRVSGPVVSTLVVSLIAVGVSIWAIVRAHVPAPQWALEGTTEDLVPELSPGWHGLSDSPGQIVQWHAFVRQLGPGVTESVSSQVRDPDGTWSDPTRVREDVGARRAPICSARSSFDISIAR